MDPIQSFPPVANRNAQLLLLGSMPGKASLAAGQYYAHPRNAFWQLMQAIFNIDTALPYQQRCKPVKKQHVAVWDVLQTCQRTTSLDSDIVESSIVVNDFPNFFKQHMKIEAIYFNGAKAEQAFRKHVLPNSEHLLHKVSLKRLPSTSPAHAAMSFEEKLKAWREIRA